MLYILISNKIKKLIHIVIFVFVKAGPFKKGGGRDHTSCLYPERYVFYYIKRTLL